MTPTTTTNEHTTAARYRRARAALVGVALVLGSTGPAHAQDAEPEPPPPPEEDANFAVQPSGPNGPGTRDWFSYTLDPGDVFGDTVAVSNLGDRPLRVRLYPTDAVSVADTAGFAALRDDEAPVDVGTWIELAADEYTIDPRTRIDVPFSVSVPEDAEPGDHAGAILAVDADDTIDAGDATTFDVLQRLGARVYVRVSGEAEPGLAIDRLDVDRDGSRATVTWEVSNTGNLRLAPTAEVRITGFLGRTIATVAATELPEILPGGNYVGGTGVQGLPGYERLTAHLVIRAEGLEVERSVGFGTYPWLLIAAALLVLALGAWYWRRRRRGRRPVPVEPPKPPSARVPELV